MCPIFLPASRALSKYIVEGVFIEGLDGRARKKETTKET
jgi:hypothetical protein